MIPSPVLHTMPRRPIRFLHKLSFPVWLALTAALTAGDLDDDPRFAHAMDIKVRQVDGFPVLFHYGQVRPDFEDAAKNPHRFRARLGGQWSFRFDPADLGEKEKWNEIPLFAKYWTDITIPHCWDMMPGGRFEDWKDDSPANPPHYNGAAWYRHEFKFAAEAGRRQRLEFLGVAQRARVYLNGREIAMHEGGGQPFSIDVTDSLLEGSNTLALKVIRLANFRKNGDRWDDIRYVHTAHPKPPDNWPYAGILRDVTLVSESPVSVRKMLLRENDGKLEAAVVIANHGGDKTTVDVEIGSNLLDQSLLVPGVELGAGDVRVVKASRALRRDTVSWSPTKPALHDVTATIRRNDQAVDQLTQRYAVRRFAARDSRFHLNDQPVFLKGVAVYEETKLRGAALLPEDHRRIMEACLSTKVNFLRLHVGQRSPLAYQFADRAGLMVTGEWGGFWYEEKAMKAQIEDPQSIYLSLGRCAVWDLMNHPSVVLWCIHNESHQFCPEYETFVKAGRDLTRELDWQKRPVTWASWHPNKGDPCFKHADAVGFNEYRGAMDPFEELEPDVTRAGKENPGKPLLILENGGWSTLGLRGAKDKQGTEDWQADLLRRQHEVLVKHIPPLGGYTYWLLADYRSRLRYTANPGKDGYSRMGLYDEQFRPKLVRDVFRDLSWR